MVSGEWIAGRFRLGELVGSGGMGVVYRAVDARSGTGVALKLLREHSGLSVTRFVMESKLLARLEHRNIVDYVAHGVHCGRPFLAMEWLEGEDLGARSGRGPCDTAEVIDIALGVTSALEAAHGLGLVHRDVKPANVFLVGGRADDVKLLDFGIARLTGEHPPLTDTGELLGTVGYVAPEQARGMRNVDARSDLFALGCLLYECATGVMPFGASNLMAGLVKLLRESPPPVGELAPHLPRPFAELVDRLLEKDPCNRPQSAKAVRASLSELLGMRASSCPARPIGSSENRFVCVVVVKPRTDGAATATSPSQLELLAEEYADVSAALPDGSAVAIFTDDSDATQLALAAARCAVSLLDSVPGGSAFIAAGRAQVRGVAPIGPAIGRATSLVREIPGEAVGLDESVASLLEARFTIERGAVPTLGPERYSDAGERRLLGKRTRFVGRRRELATLRGMLQDTIDDRVAQCALVIGEAGMGKSRLRRELVASLEEDFASTGLQILLAHADPLGAGSSLMMARGLIETGIQLYGVPAAERHSHVLEHCRGLELENVERTTDFLTELVGAPVPRDCSPIFRSARTEPRMMADWIMRSFRAWVGALLHQGPLLLLLEDLHWGDAPSLELTDGALRHFAREPLMVVGITRPSFGDRFPSLWSDHQPFEVTLAPLSTGAATRLARRALPEASDAQLSRLVEVSGGNPFYLEELVRTRASGTDELPDTILATASASLDQLRPELRRVLRVASVFGEVFWEPAVRELLGGAVTQGQLTDWLAVLRDAEVVTHRSTRRFAGMADYAFTHSLYRDAVYATLTDTDRRQAHAMAARWLENVGESEPLVVARHHERAGSDHEYVVWMERAARRAVYSGAMEDAGRAALAAVERGATGELRGRLLLWLVLGRLPSGEGLATAACMVDEARRLLPGDSPEGLLALALAVSTAANVGDTDATKALGLEFMQLDTVEAAEASLGLAGFMLAWGLGFAGHVDLGEKALRLVGERIERQERASPIAHGWLQTARYFLLGQSRHHLGRMEAVSRGAVESFTIGGDSFGRHLAQMCSVALLAWLGKCQQSRAVAETLGEESLEPYIEVGYIWSRAEAALMCGDYQAALLATTIVDAADSYLASLARCTASCAHLALGNLDAAEALVSRHPFVRSPSAQQVLAEVALAQGQAHRAKKHAVQACKGIEKHFAAFCRDRVLVRFTYWKTLDALGHPDAERALREAGETLYALADTANEPDAVLAIPLYAELRQALSTLTGPVPRDPDVPDYAAT